MTGETKVDAALRRAENQSRNGLEHHSVLGLSNGEARTLVVEIRRLRAMTGQDGKAALKAAPDPLRTLADVARSLELNAAALRRGGMRADRMADVLDQIAKTARDVVQRNEEIRK